MKKIFKLAGICLVLTILINNSLMVPVFAASKTYSTGTYIVEKDMMEGEYIITPDSDSPAYYAIFSGDNIVSNEMFKCRNIIQVSKNQTIKIKHANMTSAYDAPQVDLSKKCLPQGTYRVGIDIPANTYILRPVGSNWVYGTYEIYEVGVDNTIKIIERQQFDEETSIMVKDWQYFRVSNVNIVFPTPAPVTPTPAK